MPQPSLYLSGRSLEALGFRVETIKGPWDLPAVTDPVIAIPGRMGRMRTGQAADVAMRDIVIAGLVEESTTLRTNADLESKLETLKALFAIGLLEVGRVNQMNRLYVTRTVGFEATVRGAALAGVTAELTVHLQAIDPLAYDAALSIIGFGATRVPIPVGSAPSGGLLRIMGPATNPVITVRRLTGDVVHTLGLTRTLAATDYEEIDLDLMRLTRFVSGVTTSDANAATSGDIEDFSFSPEDGDALAGQYPTLECSGLTGDGNCEICYRRAWL